MHTEPTQPQRPALTALVLLQQSLAKGWLEQAGMLARHWLTAWAWASACARAWPFPDAWADACASACVGGMEGRASKAGGEATSRGAAGGFGGVPASRAPS